MIQDRLVAHRGLQKTYPENTLLAHRQAIAAGAHYLETDIQFSSDFVPLLYHDLSLKRLSGVEGLVSALSAVELAKLSAYEPGRLGTAYEGEPIASLKDFVELLKEYPQVTAFVEVKPQAIAIAGIPRTYEILADILAGHTKQSVLISFEMDFLLHARQRGYPLLGLVLKDWAQRQQQAFMELCPEYLFADREWLPTEHTFDDLDSTLVVYEVGDADTAIELFRRGVDMVETFDIAGMIERLGTHSI